MTARKTDLLQGTLDLIVLRLLRAGPANGWDVTNAIQTVTTGVLDVNYAGYLSKHDIVYNRPNTDPAWGLTVGNGRTGAMVWSQNGLTAQVSGAALVNSGTGARYPLTGVP